MSDTPQEEVLSDKVKALVEEATNFSITLTELAERDLTLREVALLLNNHAHALSFVDQVITDQEQRLRALMYTVAAYTKQYPLDLDKLEAGDLSPVQPQPVHQEPDHFRHPGAYL